ncbi:MAG TPA: hypothetical protein VJA46_06870 [Acidimicrobiia bacterium]|nr:hypothetical protein [Acidimicrobiia bacterium]
MSLPRQTAQRRENDRIDLAATPLLVVELELENHEDPAIRELYLWKRIFDAATPFEARW